MASARWPAQGPSATVGASRNLTRAPSQAFNVFPSLLSSSPPRRWLLRLCCLSPVVCLVIGTASPARHILRPPPTAHRPPPASPLPTHRLALLLRPQRSLTFRVSPSSLSPPPAESHAAAARLHDESQVGLPESAVFALVVAYCETDQPACSDALHSFSTPRLHNTLRL